MARSNIVSQLLAFASSEADGPDGTVDRKEGRRILSALARGSDPSIRIRAVEQLAKFDAEDRQTDAAEETTMEDTALELLRTCPEYGPLIVADCVAEQNENRIFGTPFLKELAPILKNQFPLAWERYRAASATVPEWLKDFDQLGNGPLVTVEAILRLHTKIETTKQKED